jgi:hypothetical protein
MGWVDNRLLNLMLVSHNMTPAIMFDQTGKVRQPSDMLYKKNVLLLRGNFRPINRLGMEFIHDSLAIFKEDEDYKPDNTIAFCELSLNSLMQDEEVDEKDFLHRVDLLNMMGQSVMISRFKRFFKLVTYFGQFKMIKLRVIIGLPTFDKTLDASYYTDLRGGLLEAMGALFQSNVKVYLYPYIDAHSGELIYPDDAHFSAENKLLWQYLNMTKKILVLRSVPYKSLEIRSDHITSLIENGDDSFREYVPEEVFNHIKSKELFGYNRNNKSELTQADLTGE